MTKSAEQIKQPSGNGLRRAVRKLIRLESRGARPRRLRRLSSRVMALKADYERRMAAWQAARKVSAGALIDEAARGPFGDGPFGGGPFA